MSGARAACYPRPHHEALARHRPADRDHGGVTYAGTGCPWDLEQNFPTIAPYTIEEAYEVPDAIGRGDRDELKDEFGDLCCRRFSTPGWPMRKARCLR